MPYRLVQSPGDARRRPVGCLPATTLALCGQASPGGWRRWLPTRLPEKLFSIANVRTILLQIIPALRDAFSFDPMTLTEWLAALVAGFIGVARFERSTRSAPTGKGASSSGAAHDLQGSCGHKSLPPGVRDTARAMMRRVGRTGENPSAGNGHEDSWLRTSGPAEVCNDDSAWKHATGRTAP
jgi:hypothetical protein